MESFITDFLKIYNNLIDSNNAKIREVVNDKYTIIDRSMLAVYLYVRLLINTKENSEERKKALKNYLLKQSIYGETGNLSLDITNPEIQKSFKEVTDNLIIEKFNYLNRILTNLRYNYEPLSIEDEELFKILETIAEYILMEKLLLRGNKEAQGILVELKEKLTEISHRLNEEDPVDKEVINIINSILNNEFKSSIYGDLMDVALKLRDVYRYSSFTLVVPENVLFHHFVITITSIIFSEYLNSKGENLSVSSIIYKTLFHDFNEYKGNEIVAQVKNTNALTIEFFELLASADEEDLKSKIGNEIFALVVDHKTGKEGYVSDFLDKIFAIIKIWLEVELFGNKAFIRAAGSIYQSRLMRFNNQEKLAEFNNPFFLIDLLRACYIYIKGNLMHAYPDIFLMYYTKEEQATFEEELTLISEHKEAFLNKK